MLPQPGESDLIDRLVRHGLGQGEARCYVGMLAPRAFKVSEVAGEAGLPRSRAYELIRSLVRFGLCTEVAGGVARFRAVPPNEAIGRLEAFLAEQARRRDHALNGILQAPNDRGGPPPGSGSEPVDLLRRPDQLLTALSDTVKEAGDEVVTVVNGSWLPSNCPAMRERLAAGVRFRTILDRPCLDSEPHREWFAAYAGTPGFAARVIERVDVLFSLVDQRITFLNLVVPGVGVPGIHAESLLMRHSGLSHTLHQAFERLWQRGLPFEHALEGEAVPALRGARPIPRGTDRPPPRGGNGRSADHG
jgi:HTH-type transcriptional regulator, sugar sensing transcriptional regulator